MAISYVPKIYSNQVKNSAPTDYSFGNVSAPAAAPAAPRATSGVNLAFHASPQDFSNFSYASQYAAPQAGATDVTAQVAAESAAPKKSLFRTAESRGLSWNDEALANEGFTPEEMDRLKKQGVADSTIDYFINQGWVSEGGPTMEAPVAPDAQYAPETPEAPEAYQPPDTQTAPDTSYTPDAPETPEAPSGVDDLRAANTDQAEPVPEDPVASMLAANGISADNPNYQWYYGREYNKQKTGYTSPGLLGRQGFFS